ncbi:uncharacterized protein LOC103633080 [Zea mays]|uniref:Uncharacterized protein n=2 Tax=Zea mays TaxID=4577 RepID=A0A1D6I9K8_MAIZE|nr:uncharacterized protein LOC103633080 [Zea mays]ONM56695.1 hypothetical protein ZEAMMB73_Zm00001d021272 [Zea mays]|eukprot:XP_008652984.1 uncharacterized protein LOC103633080 [Zea mays]
MEQRLPSPNSASPSRREGQAPRNSSSLSMAELPVPSALAGHLPQHTSSSPSIRFSAGSSSFYGWRPEIFSSASLFIFLPAGFPPLLLLAPSSFSLVRQQGSPARTAAMASKSLRSNAGPKTAALSLPWLRRCFVLRSEQHAVDARRVFAVFAQPHPRRLSPPMRQRRSLFDSTSALFSYD